MSFIDDIKYRILYALKRELGKLEKWQQDTADAQQWAMPDPQIYANQADFYRTSSLIGTCLDVYGNDVGLSKFNVKRMRGEDVRDIPNHDFELLMRNPNPLDSGLEFLRNTAIDSKVNGNAIWWLNRQSWSEPPREMWNMPYGMIEPVPDGKMYLKGYKYYPGNGKEAIMLPLWQIVHFKCYNPFNRFGGLSPIESLAVTLIADIGMRQTTQSRYTDMNGEPPSILAFKDWIQDTAWNKIIAKLKEAASKNKMMPLRGVGESVTWMPRSSSNRESEFSVTLARNMLDVFNRLCPGLLGMLSENATEATALASRATYSEKTLWAGLEGIAQKVTGNILPAYGLKLKGEFDDPRVVDRRLKLDEQKQYSETHTIAQINKEYYQEDESLGDERDNLLLAEVRAAQSPSSKPMISIPNNPAQDNAGENDTQPIDSTSQQDDQKDDVSLKAARAELLRLRRMALKGQTDKVAAFKSEILPIALLQAVKAKLAGTKSNSEVEQIIDGYMNKYQPKVQVDPVMILRGIELGVKALEVVQ